MTQMTQYHDLVKNILDNGIDIFNERTGTICKTIIGCQLTFDLAKGFPALTTRKLPFKSITGELLGFFRGYTSAKDFRELKCGFWNGNANETKAWLENPFRKGEDDCGRIYGSQWTDWESTVIIKADDRNTDKINYLAEKGYRYVESFYANDEKEFGSAGTYVIFKKNINQLEEIVRKILTNPSDRRIIVTGWNPGEIDFQSLCACHMDYRFIPIEQTKELHVVMTIRSLDVFLGTPANIASTALFLAIVARLTGYTPRTVIIQGTNAHLYENQFEVAKELLTRTHFSDPHLVLSDNIKKINTLDEIKGCFERIQPEDIWLEGYECHGPLTVPMVA